MSKCSFCRNEPANNEHSYEGDFIFVMCDDCDARYKKNKQLGPKFLICKCDPTNPKELDLAMAGEEIKAAKKRIQDRSGLNKDIAFEVIHETSGYISEGIGTEWPKAQSKDENDNKFKARQEEYKNSRRRKKV